MLLALTATMFFNERTKIIIKYVSKFIKTLAADTGLNNYMFATSIGEGAIW